MYLVVIWPLDVSRYFRLYNYILRCCRLGLKQNIAVKILGAYCVLGFILIQALLLGVWCKPINQVQNGSVEAKS